MNELYNYKATLDEPIRIRQLSDDFILPFFISLTNVAIYIIVFVLMIIFRKMIVPLTGGNPFIVIITYMGLPFLISKYMTKINPCGKKLHFYLYDLLIYLKKFVFKEKYCHGKKVKYIGKTYKFND